MWWQLQLTLGTSAICFNKETRKWRSEETMVALPLTQAETTFGERWLWRKVKWCNENGHQNPRESKAYISPGVPKKHLLCPTYMARCYFINGTHFFTRRQQPCQPCTQHIPTMSNCTIKQEAKGFLPSGWRRPVDIKPKSSVTVTSSSVKKQQIQTFEQCW